MNRTEICKRYQEIKAELKTKRESIKYFTKQFFIDYMEAKKQVTENYKRGIDNTYKIDNVVLTHEYDKVYTSKFYQENGGAYCVFLEIMHAREKKEARKND